jgi:hypothetical protein
MLARLHTPKRNEVYVTAFLEVESLALFADGPEPASLAEFLPQLVILRPAFDHHPEIHVFGGECWRESVRVFQQQKPTRRSGDQPWNSQSPARAGYRMQGPVHDLINLSTMLRQGIAL